jgi:hypothetical protein
VERTDLQDTSDWAHRALTARLQELSPLEKGKMLDARIEEMRQVRKFTEHLRKKLDR